MLKFSRGVTRMDGISNEDEISNEGRLRFGQFGNKSRKVTLRWFERC